MSEKPTYEELEQKIRELKSAKSQYKRMFEEQQQKEKRYQNLFDNMLHEVHVWELVFDDTGNIKTWKLVDANTAALKSWDKSLFEIVGRTADEIFPNSNTTKVFMPIVKKIFTEGTPHIWESYFPDTDQLLHMISVPIGEYFLSTGTDITERKQAEIKLAENTKKLSTVLNNTHDVIVRIDRDFKHIFANSALYTTIGMTPEQYLGKTNKEIGMPEHLCSFWRKKHQKVFATGKPDYFEFSYPTINRGERIFQAAVCPEFNGNEEVDTIISFMRDITELKNVESEKDAVIDKLEKALHEIKTLRGFIPICSNCKKIRDDKGYWQQIEQYIETRSDAQFSHSICPECAQKYYPDLDIYDEDETQQ